eukprot:5353067-Alexandrium_andersonii.AAC.1
MGSNSPQPPYHPKGGRIGSLWVDSFSGIIQAQLQWLTIQTLGASCTCETHRHAHNSTVL